MPIGSAGRMVAVTPDGRQAVVVASSVADEPAETKVLLVDLETRRIVRSTPVEPGGQPFAGARNNTVAPDGRTVGIGGTLGDVVVVDAVTGEVSPLLHAHDGFVESVTFAPDYATFVTTGRGRRGEAVGCGDARSCSAPCCRWGRTIAFGRRSSPPIGC